ncbi:hypothetical protein LTR53_016811 [Teratosphaeriaceae sp. CCFEE 6253]|nr:hypothetical protein LTR53_016811 [Teratosphaeriaceae sp. CCFEE 6253]
MDPNNVSRDDMGRVEKPHTPSSSSSHAEHRNDIDTAKRHGGEAGRTASVAARLKNPLLGMSESDVLRDADLFVDSKDLSAYRDSFRKGAMLARVGQREDGFEQLTIISEEEKGWLRHEVHHRWSQPFMLYFLVVLCAGSAIVQGMDQTAVNGAQVGHQHQGGLTLDRVCTELTFDHKQFYFEEYNITNTWTQGLLNGAPYLCSTLLGCWMNAPLNKIGGRRFTIFVPCVISFISGIWMAAADSWYNLLIARFALGFAVGAKSSTTPVYAAESAPKNIRGALTMMWQMWTAFGIMLGFVVSVAFQNTDFLGEYSQWRWMLASTSIPPFIVCFQVYFCPESPRWYMEKGKFGNAFNSLKRLRPHEIQAARDMYYAFKLLEVESAQREGKNLLKEFFLVRRNRRAAQSAFFVMYMQQFCGVNVIAYYSTAIFETAGFTRSNALLVSMGTGITNFLFAIPAIYTIDTFGRRNLLLLTYPLMAICLLWCALSFLIPNGPYNPETQAANVPTAKLGSIAAAIFTFMAVYSPGSGPVPFTYSAEAFPLYIRDIGMSFATATCWGFNFIVSLTWPSLQVAFTPTGAFCWYAGWNVFGWVYAYFLLPETKGRTLEELDSVFDVGNREHFNYYRQKLPWYMNRWILRRDVPHMQPLIHTQDEGGDANAGTMESNGKHYEA